MATNLSRGPQHDFLRHRRTGAAHHSGLVGSRSAVILVANAMRGVAFVTSKPISVDAISIEVTTAGSAGSKTLLAMYTDDGNGYPNSLVAGTTSAELVTDTTGLKRTTFTAVALQPDSLYWLVAYPDGAATPPTLRSVAVSTMEALLGVADNTVPGANPIAGYSVARTYDATMPATFPAGAALGVAASSIIILVEVP